MDAFIAAQRHPLEAEIRRIRALVLGMDPAIRDEVKWNSVSFRNAADFFATVNLRSTTTLQLVVYTGVKKKETAVTGVQVADPSGLIEKWAAKDRCLLSLGRGEVFAQNEPALVALMREWLIFVV